MQLALSPNARGALFMTVAMTAFTINDAITKLSSTGMNMGQVMLVRGIFATALIAAIAWHRGAFRQPSVVLHPTVGLRAICEIGGTVSFLVALAHLPIANVSAVLQALPLAVTMGAALFFGEPVGWRRWLAITVGFAGVLIIVRPGFEGFSAHAIWALISVFFCALRDLATRGLPPHVPTSLVSTVTAASVTLAGGVLVGPFGGWSPMSTDSVGLLAGAAILLVIGYQFIIMAMRTGDISAVAPFRYTALLSSILLGIVIFGDRLDLAMIIGSVIIVGSGLYTLYRERLRGRERPAAESSAPNMAVDGV